MNATREFTNELGNRIKITIEGPASISENILTKREFTELREAIGSQEDEHVSDEDRIAYWKGAYERMAARNHLLFAPIKALGFGEEEKIGWRGTFPAPSTDAHFRCEFCDAEHVNSDEIPHSSECPVTLARAALKAGG